MVGYDPNVRQELPKYAYGAAGAISGVITRCVAQPLDVLKIRFQLQVEPLKNHQGSKYHNLLQASSSILREEGVKAFWKGHVPAQYLSITYAVVQFVGFEVLTKRVGLYKPEYLTTNLRHLTHSTCGAIVGGMASVTAQPFDVLRTRFVAQGEPKIYKNIVHAARSMVKHEGVRSLWKGLGPTLLQVVPQTGLQFGFFSLFKSLWDVTFTRHDGTEFASYRSLTCGAAAGFGAKMVIYPLDVMKKRFQVQGFGYGRQGFGSTDTYNGIVHCVKTVARKEGFVRGFYKGLSPSLIKAVVTASCNFWAYEWCCYLMSLHSQR